jgi:hypothetical protein
LCAARALWSVNSLHLYDVAFELRRGTQVLDRVKSCLGFSSVVIESGRVGIDGQSPCF